MKNLPLLLAGIGAIYLLRESQNKILKKVITDAESETEVKNSNEFKIQGYKIDNCKLTIYNKQKALDYAFKLGFDAAIDYDGNIKYFEKSLLGDCAETEKTAKILMSTKEKALFVFDLLKYLYSGLIFGGAYLDELALDALQKMKTLIEKTFKYNVSDFKVEIVKKS